MTSIAGLPDFLVYLGTGAGLTGLYLVVYTLATAHNELALIRRDVTAASVSLGGSLLGFTLPLAVAIYNARSVLDCLVWGLVALVVQVGVYWLVRLVLPDLSRRIEDDRIAAALLLGAASLAGGVLNAASMTY
ncbi:hypothetical protein DK419_11005 [Methylobacterium terrae]|uniref:DUF350 domain-containing protein n=1 Tax=Methylobacterium terrae TaxID=2202827 RepID=A0A2U8WNH9_9HYPH|nr:DUF350 domain-containing protein [Methylobacterium terrae]AWN46772.1 hypothetical protein DK419_11005 [Methylobacterium terrae]